MKNSRSCWRRIEQSHMPALFGLSFCLLLLAALASLCLGAVKLSPDALIRNMDILRFIRIPRTLAAIFAGAGLAGTGVIIQTLLGNPLAGPNIIGVNAGAGFMVLAAGLLFPLQPRLPQHAQ